MFGISKKLEWLQACTLVSHVDWLEYVRDARIRHDPALIHEAVELAKILAVSVRTARANTNRMKKLPKG